MLYYSNGTRHAQNQGLIAYAATGTIFSLYAGTQPVNANTAITSQVKLVSLVIPGVFGSDVNGTLTLGAVTDGVAIATGTSTFFRITKSDGTTVIMDGSVGTSGTDLVLDTAAIVTGQTVSISSGTIIRNNQ